jgi:hypothetical protein
MGRPARRFAVDDRCLESLAPWHRWLRPSGLADAGFVTRIAGGAARRARPSDPASAELVSEITEPPAEPAAITIRLPRIDEHSVGQLLQLLALSAAVEEHLRRGV